MTTPANIVNRILAAIAAQRPRFSVGVARHTQADGTLISETIHARCSRCDARIAWGRRYTIWWLRLHPWYCRGYTLQPKDAP